MNAKKIALIALLAAVIAVAAVVTVRRIRNEERNTPTLYVDQMVEKIDMKSYEVFTETAGDWMGKYAHDASGRYKNPRTGEYTMVDIMRCASCGQPIPVPEMPTIALPKSGSGKRSGFGANPARTAAIEEFQRNYKCPKCGKNAFVIAASPSPAKSK